MLQQTQVSTVLPYYARFVQRFPSVQALAAAAQTEVLRAWAGLGYYARARNLHACAQQVAEHMGGVFPRAAAELAQLPGIGRSTAAAIAAFCFGERAAILDGNVKRVLARCFGVEGFPGVSAVERELWALAQSLLPKSAAHMPTYTQALMDLGATVCTRRAPRCEACPLRTECVAHLQNRTHLLPTPRAARVRPQRRVFWLVLLAGRKVWLQRRSPRGIWAGLLAPPEFTSRAALRRWLKNEGIDAQGEYWPERQHAFTHLQLCLTPYVVQLSRTVRLREGTWLELSEAAAAEVPTPVRALLMDLRR